MTQPLMGLAEIRILLRLSPAAAKALTERPSFPAPVADLAMGKVWSTYAVTEWIKATGRDAANRPVPPIVIPSTRAEMELALKGDNLKPYFSRASIANGTSQRFLKAYAAMYRNPFDLPPTGRETTTGGD